MAISEESWRIAIEFATADVRRTPRAKDFDKQIFIFARVNCLVAVGCADNLGLHLRKGDQDND
jgi:hypothetical protein